MKEIRGDAKTVRALLSGAKYSIDYYQREYKWERKQVAELLDDLVDKFLESYDDEHERSSVEQYGHYFLGSIIISDNNGQKFIIDGQQRLTTLSLLLIFLHNLERDRDDQVAVAELIFSEKYGKRSFNLQVPERAACMQALFDGDPFDDAGQPEAVRNLCARYADIEDLFPEELTGRALPYFVDWLLENVHLVEITAYSDEDAYTIFETMNDRGLSLAPTDMLKGYLLANILDGDQKLTVSRAWKHWISRLLDFGREEDADCLKSWLRGKHAKTIRERKRGAIPQDFDRIGSEFHRWVRDHREELGLLTSNDFARFIDRDFAFFARQYERLRNAALSLTPGLETVFYNAQHEFTLQYPVLLAPLCTDDSEQKIGQKWRVVGAYLDILLARRIWNWRAIGYSTMQYAMFLVIRDIRGREPSEIASLLRQRLDADSDSFRSNDRFRLHGTNGRQVHRMLARITDYSETQSGGASRLPEYLSRSGKQGYEIEHIWADHPDRHHDEFADATDFQEYRNRIGGLLLLPKSFNASYGDLPYAEKRKYYDSQNLLARSLHENCYERNPGFLAFANRSGIPFRPHQQFRRADLDVCQELYARLAEEVWNPNRLHLEGPA